MTGAAVDFERFVEQIPDAVIGVDVDGVILVWNSGAERIFGHTAEAALGQTLDLIVPERFHDAHWSGFAAALDRGATKYEGQSLPTRSMRNDGTAIYVELSFSISITADGLVDGAIATARDITERFATERAQRARLADLERQLEALPAGDGAQS